MAEIDNGLVMGIAYIFKGVSLPKPIIKNAALPNPHYKTLQI
jgi:hypothetical protein